VADPADPATFEAAVLDPTLTEREPHRSRLAMYTELLQVRRAHRVLTDPAAQQHVSMVGDTVFVVRSTDEASASLIFNFGADALDHPAPDPVESIVFDTEDDRWGGAGVDARTIRPWSARLAITS
jgi:hypothetical protein